MVNGKRGIVQLARPGTLSNLLQKNAAATKREAVFAHSPLGLGTCNGWKATKPLIWGRGGGQALRADMDGLQEK